MNRPAPEILLGKPHPASGRRAVLSRTGRNFTMKEHQTSNLLLGMAAGAALGAAGMMAVSQNPRKVKRAARKMAKGAEQAVMQLDKMVTGFMDEHK